MTLILSGTNGVSDVDGSASTPAIRGSDTNTGIFFPAADTIAFAEGGAEVARFDSGGNFCIGSSSPGSAGSLNLSVGNPGTTVGGLQLWSTTTGTHYVQFGDSASGGAPYSGALGYSHTSDAMLFLTNQSERARITSGGDLLVGKTSSTSTVLGAQVNNNGQIFSTMSGSTNGSTTLEVYSTGASAYRFYVGLGGTIFATSTTITAISDQRLKENIQDIDAGLAQIMALKPRKFDWKEGKGKDIKGDRGWIAQEFEQVFPDMVDKWRDPAPEGEEPYKAVNADLIPVLVKAIQELKAELDTAKARIAALEAA